MTLQIRLALLASVMFMGCPPGCLEKLAPRQVAAGVARLSIRQLGVAVKAGDLDQTCGFTSPAALRGALIQGQPGQEGAVTWTIKDCEVRFDQLTTLSKDCAGAETRIKGAMTISGTKRVRGIITGDAKTPVIPAGADSVEFTVDVAFDNFYHEKSDSGNKLETHFGSVHAVVQPHLALSKSLGLCAVSTADSTLAEVVYSNAKMTVTSPDRTFPVDVPSVNLVAQSGKWRKHENDFSGQVTVWETPVTLPLPKSDDPDGLDPAYTPDAYLASIACDPDLVKPIVYSCPSPREQVTHGAARLSISHFGAITSLIDGDKRCGFSSPAVLAKAKVTGTTGGPGSVTFTLPNPCTISFPTTKVIGKNCLGVEQSAVGTVIITGTKTLTGILTGSVEEPVAPDARDPASLNLTAQFQNFKITDTASTNALTAVNGTLTGTIEPRVALDTRTGICSNSTSTAKFSNVTWSNATLEVLTNGLTFQIAVSNASLEAQNGSRDGITNSLTGVMVADSVPITIPPAGAPPDLDPSFDATTFESTFSCKPGYQAAPSDAACDVDQALAINAARLIIQTAGTAAAMIQSDLNCGFSATLVQVDPTKVIGSEGSQGSLQWDVQHCRIGQGGVTERNADCAGTKSFFSGTADFSAQRIVKGLRDSKYVFFDSIIPQTSDALSITLTNVVLLDFAAYSVKTAETDPFAKLVIRTGSLAGKVTPALGERASTPGVHDVATPVASFENIVLSNATATLEVAGKRFTLTIPATQLNAVNGTVGGVTNSLSGWVNIGGKVVNLPAMTPLDPAFSQTTFDSSYACTADLSSVLPH